MFTVTEEQHTQIEEWLKGVYAKQVIIQQNNTENPSEIMKYCWEKGVPYTGAIGGGLTYSFTPTSVGVGLIVKESLSGETLDVTDYENW